MDKRSNIVRVFAGKAPFLLLALVLVVAVSPATSFSAEKTAAEKALKSDKPIKITSNSLEADNNAKKIYFRGSVHAVQGDVDITCDVMSVTYNDRAKDSKAAQGSAGQDIEHIVARGNVVITQQKRVITGQQAEFFQKNRTIVITGNPVAKEGQNIIRGGKITFYIDENKSVVEGGHSKQVEAVIYPGEKNGG